MSRQRKSGSKSSPRKHKHKKEGNKMFASPAAASGIDLKELNGALLLIEPTGIEEDIATVHGPSSAIRGDVSVLDGALKGETYEDTLLFPKVLQGQLRPRIGQKVLGRLGQGVAKPGQSAPWTLNEATDADKQTATEFLNQRSANQTATPAAPF